jgi:hypothetical protein
VKYATLHKQYNTSLVLVAVQCVLPRQQARFLRRWQGDTGRCHVSASDNVQVPCQLRMPVPSVTRQRNTTTEVKTVA